MSGDGARVGHHCDKDISGPHQQDHVGVLARLWVFRTTLAQSVLVFGTMELQSRRGVLVAGEFSWQVRFVLEK
eukprot:694451-Amphidinium_carterae.1